MRSTRQEIGTEISKHGKRFLGLSVWCDQLLAVLYRRFRRHDMTWLHAKWPRADSPPLIVESDRNGQLYSQVESVDREVGVMGTCAYERVEVLLNESRV